MRLIREAQIITLDHQPQQPSKQSCYLETLKEPNIEYRNEKDYYSFMLEPGKSLSVQLGFFVERKFVEEQDLYLKLGAIRNNLCGIALQPMKK